VTKKKNNRKKKSTKSLRDNGDAPNTPTGENGFPVENGEADGEGEVESEVVRVTPVYH